MATYEPFLIYITRFSTVGVGGYETETALPVTSPDPFEVICYYDVPEIASLDEFAVAIWAEFADLQGLEVQVFLPDEPSAQSAYWPLSIDSPSTGGNGADLGTSDGDAVFDFDNTAPPYYDDDTWTYIEPPPLVGRWLAAEWTGNPSGGSFATHMGSSVPASDTTLGSAGAPVASWAVVFKFSTVETSSGVFEQLPVTVHRASLTINEAPAEPETFHEPFTVQVTPLIAPAGNVSIADLVDVEQFADLTVTHPLNGGRTAQVTLSMDDPVVETLEPYEFALRVLYGYDGRHEPVFWGQAWFDEDYDAGTITIYAQDPSLRLQHHYLRLGDDALNNGDTGELTADYIGIRVAIDAARNTTAQDTRGDPDLGIAEGTETDITLIDPIQVERGQECWDVINQLADHRSGPDFDLHPIPTLPASNYVEIDCYGSEDNGLGRDLTPADPDAPASGEVVFDYGVGQDNLAGVTHRPGRPTTHAHVVDGLLARASRGNVEGSTATGVFVDWIGVDFMEVIQSGSSLTDVAEGRVAALGRPPKFLELELRPDAVQSRLYGHPDFPTNPGDFYVGDTVTVRAERGHRSFSTPARITEVQLTQAGWRAPAVTVVKVLPTVDGEAVDEEQ